VHVTSRRSNLQPSLSMMRMISRAFKVDLSFLSHA